MGSRVGYIAGCTLGSIQEQWVALLDAGVDVILFDRRLYKGGALATYQQLSKEEKEITDYVQIMAGTQDMVGNTRGLSGLDELVAGDVIVLSSLDVLEDATTTCPTSVLNSLRKGVGLVLLDREDVLQTMSGTGLIEELCERFGLE